jgi:hypothetical protein
MKFVSSGRWLSDFVGTSFAAPKIAHAAGLLLKEYGAASANLLRALLVAHASAPALDTSSLRPEFSKPKDTLRHWGYGQINPDRLVHSVEHCVSIFAEATIRKDQHHFYELPLPADFLQPGRGSRRISIGLSHLPPVRTTRLEYRACKMAFRLVAATDLDELSRVFMQTKKDAREDLIKEFRPGFPSSTARGRGSVQAARYKIDQLPGGSEALRLFVVVTQSVLSWGDALVTDDEPYALAIVIEERDRQDVRYFTQMQAKLQQRARERGRIKG